MHFLSRKWLGLVLPALAAAAAAAPAASAGGLRRLWSATSM